MTDFLIRQLIRAHVWALVRKAKREGQDETDTKRLAVRELSAVDASIREFIAYQKSETEILSERLGRRYDIGMAMNEAANRAIAQKQAARDPQLTEFQKMALRVQEETLRRSIDRA